MSFTLKIFLPDGAHVAFGDDELRERAKSAPALTSDERALYDTMRSSDIDMAHVQYDSNTPTTQGPRVAIFGTFYVNLSAFKK